MDADPQPWTPAPRPSPGGGRRLAYASERQPRHWLRFLVFSLGLAAVVLVVLVTVLRPLVAGAVVAWADDNPGAYRLPVVGDLVRDSLGSALTEPAGTNADPVEFTVDSGDTPSTLAPRLAAAHLIANERAFLYEATMADLGPQLQAGQFLIAGNLTPAQVVAALINNRITQTTRDVTFREGLRIEQITAQLETIQSGVDPKAFYDLAEHPPASLVADYPFLKGRPWPSLEGFLYPATYTLRTGPNDPTRAEELVRMMLDAFQQHVGDALDVPKSRGLTAFQVLVLASMVEKEAKLDTDRPLIAGVFQNRLSPKLFPNGHLGSDPTIFYVHDSLELASLPFAQWQQYLFWAPLPRGTTLPAQLPSDLAGFNTYTHPGLPPAPICSPALASIQAAVDPNTKAGYLYFLATPEGSIVYAKTFAEHQANIAKYGQP
jgi:UPF0755 protein